MAHRDKKLTDARVLRAVAHPVRLALLEQLMLHGAATASELADRIDETPANCSWHLRKLAEHGFVEEAGGGQGRARPWRAVAEGMSWDASGAGPEETLAGEALSQVLIEREVARFADSRARVRADDAAWQQASDASQSLMWLTAEELGELNREVRELFVRHLERHRDPSLRPDGARLCALVQWGVPAYGLDPAEAD